MTNRSEPPLILDIDGTLTLPQGEGIDSRLFPVLRNWDSSIMFATGKAFPYPITLAHFIGLPEIAVAENGGVVYTGEDVIIAGDGTNARALVEEFEASGHELIWGPDHPLNRWRETEIILSLDQPEEPLRELASSYGLDVINTGYAYHIKQTNTSKGEGVETLARARSIDLSDAIAIGDSINDVSAFEVVGHSYAVANADASAKQAADEVLRGEHAEGTLNVLKRFCD